MDGIGPGSVIEDRYAMIRRLRQYPHAQRWEATDQLRGARVSLLTLAAGLPTAPEVIDAARQAATLQARRLAKVVGSGVTSPAGSQTGGRLAYVVEEYDDGARTLAELLEDGPLSAEHARRLVGECAMGLASATSRGMHHLMLGPDSVLELPDGQVKLRGVAVEAALAGRDATPEDSGLADTAGLVALLYAGLTGHWPRPAEEATREVLVTPEQADLPVAPLVDGRLAPVTRFAAGTPDDLVELCAGLDHPEGMPGTPADLAKALGPWAVVSFGQRPAAADASAPDAATPSPGAPEPAASDSAASDSAEPEGATAEAAEAGIPDTGESADADRARPAAGVTAALGAALAAGRKAADGVKHEVVARREQAAAQRAERRAEHEQWEREFLENEATRTSPLEVALETAPEEPPEPVLPTLPPVVEPPSRRSTTILLAVIAALLVIAGAFAIRGLPFVANRTPTAAPTTSSATDGATTEPSGTRTGSPSPTNTTVTPVAPGAPLTVTDITVFNPGGGQTEAPERAKLAVDGDVTTQWRSTWYRHPDFNGTKPGVGLLLDLGEPKTVGSVTLTLPQAGQAVSYYVTSSPSTAGAAVVAENKDAKGEVLLSSPIARQGRYVIVWISRAGEAGTNQYRAMINEIKVTT